MYDRSFCIIYKNYKCLGINFAFAKISSSIYISLDIGGFALKNKKKKNVVNVLQNIKHLACLSYCAIVKKVRTGSLESYVKFYDFQLLFFQELISCWEPNWYINIFCTSPFDSSSVNRCNQTCKSQQGLQRYAN